MVTRRSSAEYVKTLMIPGERNCILIDVNPGFLPLEGSVDCFKVVDNGDCVDLVIDGKIADLPVAAKIARINRYIWMAAPANLLLLFFFSFSYRNYILPTTLIACSFVRSFDFIC